MRKGIIGVAAALVLAGCASTPGDYEFGDITGGVLSMQAEYCAEQDPRQRTFRIAALRAAGVPIPPSGACTDILELVPDADADVEQAREDQERFQEE